MTRPVHLLALLSLPWALQAQTTHELTNAGSTFSPNLITMQAGDIIHLVLNGPHTCTQVDEATWEANGTTSNGGFDFPNGEHSFSLDTAGTYYYVCVNHASMGMKGRIIVTGTTGVGETVANASLQLFPNPAQTRVRIAGLLPGQAVQVIDVAGKLVLKAMPAKDGLLDISPLGAGNYSVAIRDAKGVLIATKPLVIVR